MPSRAERLRTEFGQSVWLDFIRRGPLVSGEFDRQVREDGVAGVTSNPTIFHMAITQANDYDAAISQLLARGLSDHQLFETLAIEDIQMACDRLRGLYDATGGLDGRVSIEVNPHLAHDTQGTLDEALRLHREVARENVMVKIPATAEGLPAITAALAEGLSINVTLIFSLARYEQVMEAYVPRIDHRLGRGAPVDRVFSVASFFVSRVDAKVDAAIDQAMAALPATDPRRGDLAALKGQAAVANARLAYQRFQKVFGSPRFSSLQARGARLQRPLWASTSTKNPAYPDTLYVDELIGSDTVNTMPPQTLEATNDHGNLEARIEFEVDRAQALFDRLPRLAVPIHDLIGQLEPEGVAAFSKSYDALIAALAEKRARLGGAAAPPPASEPFALPAAEAGPIRARVEHLERDGFPRRLFARDTTLWSDDPAHQAVARNRLGWLESPRTLKAALGELRAFADSARKEGFERAVLLGMGGSSLAPEVLFRTFDVAPGAMPLTVLDSTSPAAVRAVTSSHDPRRTLFLVASKSGGTLEVSTLERHFHAWVAAARGADAGRAFAAITDPGTSLEQLARTRGYRATFLNPADIGGRYSALSFFGLVPAALLGIDVGTVLDGALAEAQASRPESGGRGHGFMLGAALGDLATRGRNKVTLVLGPEIGSFGLWVEQLIAESTGKDGKGLIPITGEPLGTPEAYGPDRVFVAMSVAPLARETEAALLGLERAGHPVLRWRLPALTSLGAEFMRWEIATATAARVLSVDPFDEPNVTEAKKATQAMLERYLADGRFPATAQLASAGGVEIEAPAAFAEALRSRANGGEPPAWAAALLGLARPGDYLAVLAYWAETPKRNALLERLRLAARQAARIATTVGYGPRYLHSTGQLHKGGPDAGLFLVLTADEGEDVAIPGERYGFATLIRAQAAGDYQTLEQRGRRVMRVHLGDDPERALDALIAAMEVARV